MKSLSRGNLKKLDKTQMLNLLLDFPGQCLAAADIAKNVTFLFEKKDFSKIIFCGMGGSAIGADLVKAYLYFESKVPIIVLREYELPAYIEESSLVFICSYSGNTEETLSAYKCAKEKGATMVVISSGGKLKEYSLRDKVTFAQIPPNLPPRCALGYHSIVPLRLLNNLGLIKDATLSLNQAVRIMEELKSKSLNPDIAIRDNIAKSAALKLYNKFVVVYASSAYFDVCATRLRGQLAENSKAISSSHLFPEMNHNEIAGWQNPGKQFKNFAVVILRDKGLHPRIAKRMDITKDIFKQIDLELIEIWSRGEDLLSRIFSLIYIGDFITYYLAILYGVDPTPVERITYLKNQLAKE